MARLGIQYRDVKSAAIKLLTQGNAPSVQKVRACLGTGSHTTIAEHLKTWRAEHADQVIQHLPSNIPEEVIAAMEVFWQTAVTQATGQMAAIKTDLQAQQEKVIQDKAIMDEAVAQLRLQLGDSQKKADEYATKNQSLQTELAVVQTQLVQQRDEISTHKNQYDARLKRAYDEKSMETEKSEKLQTRLTQLQEQLAQQTENYQQKLNADRALQEQSEKRWLQLIDKASLEAKQWRKNHEGVLKQHAKQVSSLQGTLLDYQTQLATLQSTLEHKHQVIHEQQEQLRKNQQDCLKTNATLAVLKSELQKAKEKEQLSARNAQKAKLRKESARRKNDVKKKSETQAGQGL